MSGKSKKKSKLPKYIPKGRALNIASYFLIAVISIGVVTSLAFLFFVD
jgi:hypothetical protein